MEADVATRASRPAGWLRAPLLPPGMEAASPREIASAFGTEFAAEVDAAPVGQWSGRVQSGFGMHVARVEERPVYLEIRETSQNSFDVLWKVPVRGECRLGMYVRLPESCSGAPAHGSSRSDAE